MGGGEMLSHGTVALTPSPLPPSLRVALARAILKRAPILLLDEATSALDTVTEAAVQKALGGGVDGRPITRIIVAHRLSTVADCDAAIVMRGGEVVERGAHADLVAAGGLYADLWSRQAAAGGVVSFDDAAAAEEEAAKEEGEGGAPSSGPPHGHG